MNALPPLPPLPTPPERKSVNRADLLPDVVRTLYSQTGVSLSGNLLGGMVLTMIYWPVAPHHELVAWCVLFGLVWVLRLVLSLIHISEPTRPAA
jgi:hypothetical protein